jgi:DNA-binding NarL/FixJ family response regulator
MRIRTLLIDDNQTFLNAASDFLSKQPKVEIVGAMTSGELALAMLPVLEPHLILLDWKMPGIDGLETARRLKALPNSPYIIMLTLHDGPHYRVAAKSAKIDGYLNKQNWFVELLPLIDQLYEELECNSAPPANGRDDNTMALVVS